MLDRGARSLYVAFLHQGCAGAGDYKAACRGFNGRLRAVFLMGVCVPCSFLFIVLGTVRHPPLAQEGVEVGVVSMGDGHGTPAGFVLWHA